MPRPSYLSFDDEAEGDKYVEQLERLLTRGIVPDEFRHRQHELRTVQDAIRAYQRTVAVLRSDQDILGVVQKRLGRDQPGTIDYAMRAPVRREYPNLRYFDRLSADA